MSRFEKADADQQDDAWGSFSSGSTPAHNENAANPFGDDNFDAFDESFTPSVQARSASSAPAPTRGQPLTPHDWFDREFNEAWGDEEHSKQTTEQDSSDEEGDGTPSIVIPKLDDEDDSSDTEQQGGSSAPIPIPSRDAVPTSDAALDKTATSPSASGSASRPAGSPARRAPPPPPPPNRRRAGSGAAPPSPSVLLGASQSAGAGGVSKKGASPLSQDALVEAPEMPSLSPSVSPSKPIDMASERPDRKLSGHGGGSGLGESGGAPVDGSALSLSPLKTALPLSSSPTGTSPTSPTTEHRRRRSSVSNPPDPALIAATNDAEPLGPGVSKDTRITEGGMLKKQTDSGEEVVVPMDEVALGVDEAMADD